MSFIDWTDIFEEVFDNSYPDKWTLTFVNRNSKPQQEKVQQHAMQRTGYARFHCPKCSKAWASAKAQALILYSKSRKEPGVVKQRFFGQECKRCSKRSLYYVDPEFDDEFIVKCIEKLHERIGCTYYGKKRPKIDKTDSDSKVNNIKGPHESSLCEACKLGFCDEA